jgi:hypothetical protein
MRKSVSNIGGGVKARSTSKTVMEGSSSGRRGRGGSPQGERRQIKYVGKDIAVGVGQPKRQGTEILSWVGNAPDKRAAHLWLCATGLMDLVKLSTLIDPGCVADVRIDFVA